MMWKNVISCRKKKKNVMAIINSNSKYHPSRVCLKI